MPLKTWIGGDSGNENTWNHAPNWAEGNVPAVGDDVLIAESTFAIAGFDATGTALSSVSIAASMTGNIGSSANPLQLNVDSLRFDGRQTAAFIEVSNGGSPVEAVHVIGTRTTTAPATEGLHLRFADDVTSVILLDGMCTIETGGAGAVGTVISIGGTHRVLPAVENLINAGASVTASGGMTTLDHQSGTTSIPAGDIATVNISAGVVQWNGEGDITSRLNIFGGTFDSAANANAFEIAATAIYNGVLDARAGLGQPQFFTAPVIHGRDAVLLVDAGRRLTVA